MQVILRENVRNLGRIGDIVEVSDGYARNFLLPRNLVVAADRGNVAVIEHHQRALAKKAAAQKAEAEGAAKKLESFTCTLNRKVGENNKLFGSVNAGDIADALRAGGFEIDKRSVHLHTPIKATGEYTVTVKLQSDVSADLKVVVAKEE